MPRFRWSLFFAIISLLATTVSHAQRTPSSSNPRAGVGGAITSDGDHRPIANAKVQLTSSSGEMMSSTYTGNEGQFSFMNLSQGEYVITVTAVGYETNTQKVMIFSASVPDVRLSLRKTNSPVESAPLGDGSVSNRELLLPKKAQEAFQKGLDTLYKKNDPSGSILYFQKVLAISPDFYEAYYNQGRAYSFVGKPADAEAAFQKAIELSKNSYADADFGLAAIFSDRGRFKESEQLSRHGLELQPDVWRGYFELARALDGMGHTREAEQNGLEARKMNPTFSGIYIVLANIHLELHNDNALVEDLNAYLRLDPSGPFAAQAKDLRTKTEKLLNSKGVPSAPHPN
jgi:predicted Zn-dependent protease